MDLPCLLSPLRPVRQVRRWPDLLSTYPRDNGQKTSTPDQRSNRCLPVQVWPASFSALASLRREREKRASQRRADIAARMQRDRHSRAAVPGRKARRTACQEARLRGRRRHDTAAAPPRPWLKRNGGAPKRHTHNAHTHGWGHNTSTTRSRALLGILLSPCAVTAAATEWRRLKRKASLSLLPRQRRQHWSPASSTVSLLLL